MKEIDSLFFKLEASLIELNIPSVALLNPGVSKQYVSELFDGMKLSIDESTVSLFNWKNGVGSGVNFESKSLQLFPHAFFPSIEYSLLMYLELVRSVPINRIDSLFPLFTDGGGIFYMVDLDKNSSEFRMIIECNIGSTDFDILISKYDNLESLLLSVVTCYKNNIYYLEEKSQVLTVDFEKEREVRIPTVNRVPGCV